MGLTAIAHIFFDRKLKEIDTSSKVKLTLTYYIENKILGNELHKPITKKLRNQNSSNISRKYLVYKFSWFGIDFETQLGYQIF